MAAIICKAFKRAYAPPSLCLSASYWQPQDLGSQASKGRGQQLAELIVVLLLRVLK